ncbi:hypothetical protein TSOC_009602 [Tetrabaena socialis]|uniref:Uncharacterized protein n=1 Tax=Tetrabaena socialis TaxID=47790 RepID=A0A2J7ZVG3_9CHLO|nr:hypothetical protein TSOC_009602 [Tetrabaena socialis]|eukprot:PNH04254.1 hypothetical protein TSOC_009602 [Tetrabaena socialis]
MATVALDSRDFLTSCLKTCLEQDLVDAIADQAVSAGYNAVSIGRFSVDELKDRLYLTADEARAVLRVCASFVTGTKPTARVMAQGPVSVRLLANSTGLRLRLNVKDVQPQQAASLPPATISAKGATDTSGPNAESLSAALDAAKVDETASGIEAERKVQELADMSVDDFRKTLEFKARTMPDFSAPFRPDPSLSRPITAGAEPALHTVKRLGAAPSPNARKDKEGPGLGNGVYDGAGYVDPFFASLRKSASVAMGPRSPGAADKAAMRRSAAVRQSASPACGAGGPVAMRVSVGSALQAAIRAAAQDAAREAAASPAARCGASTVDVAVGSPRVRF